MNKIDFIPREKCCGCSACANTCGRAAITMTEDKNGFLYPAVDAGKCVDCGMCKKHCPMVMQQEYALPQHCRENYAGYLRTEEIGKCASGGAATAFSRAILRKGGTVYGVVYKDRYRRAETVEVCTEEELHFLRDSKYMQSDKKQIYKQLRERLKEGTPILFIGTPCEIGAVRAFLGKDYQQLYLCELICHGATSYKVAEQYLDSRERDKGSMVSSVSVKSKEKGWKIPYLKVEFENGDSELDPFYETDYGIGFTELSRESCYQCMYKGERKVADITVGDFWGAKETDSYWNPQGISAIMVHTEKGSRLLKEMQELQLFQVEYSRILKGNEHLEKSVRKDRLAGLYAYVLRRYGLKPAARGYRLYRSIVKWIKGVGH